MEYGRIAIVGIAAQIPSGASLLDSEAADLDYNSLWQFLLQGGQAYTNLKATLDFPQSPIRLPTHGCLLKNAENFDNLCFGVSVKDARVMPFSARRLLDLSFRALEDSGINSRGQNVGCFMSGNQHLATQTNIDADGSFAWLPHALANRISYALDLTGPSMTIDTACNSSLTALHLAISALQAGECSAALVGAAQINRDFFEWQTYVQGGVSSPNGICKPFDASANGFGRGEGVIAVVLKPLAAALRDNDRIYAEIVGSAINATGSRLPLNVPSGSAQEFCIREAFRKADIDPEDADYVELHATGTAVGDPIEVNAAGSIFAGPQTTNFGSIKGNIGHLELTAFLASLAKACLIFEHGIIPPTVNFSVPNPSIHWHDFNIAVPREPTLLGCRSSTGQSTISISAAGLGGSTGHVVLQGPRKRPTSISPSINSHVPTFFIVGGQSAAAAEQIARASCAMDRAELQSVSVTLARRARQLPWRTCFISSPSAGVIEIPPATLVPAESPSLVYVFSGQGPQNLQMARQLFAEFPVFRDTILELDNVCRAVHGSSVIETTGLFSHDSSCTPSISLQESGWPVVITVSAIAMVQIALFDLLKSVGVLPEMVLGHSAGETTALYASGAGSKAMALEVAIVRGEAMTSTEKEELGMVALGCGEIRSIALIARAKETVDGVAEISCYNAPESVSVSGNAPLLNKIVALAKGAGILAQRIRTMVPGHSSFMDTIKEDYIRRMEDIWARYPGPHKPVIPVLSTCRKDVFVDTFTPSYFWDNCRNPVLFSKAIGCSLSTAHVYVEISSHPVLSTSVLAHGVLETRILCPMRRLSAEQPHVTETTTLLNTLGRLSLLGMNAIDLSGIYGYSTACPTTIKHPLIQRTIPPPKSFGLQSHHASQRILSGSHLMLSAATHPDLAEHVISGEPIFPATAYIELLLEQGVNYLWDMEFKAILSIPSEKALAVELDRHESSWSVRTNAAEKELEHACGCMDKSPPPPAPLPVNVVVLFEQLPALDVHDFYPSLQSRATYGLPFQRLVRCNGRPTEVIAEIEGLSVEEFARGYTLHPVILDACLHIMLHRDIARDYSDKIMYLPTRLEHFTFYRRTPAAGNWYSHLRLLRWAPDSREYDVVVLDANGEVLCEFKSLVVKKLRLAPPPKVTRRYQPIIQPVFIVAEIPTIAPTFSRRRDHDEVKKLGLVLDGLAARMIAKSLESDLDVGDDVSRLRYLAFCHRVLNQRLIEVDGDDIEDLQKHWPYHFEITRRVMPLHASVFITPQLVVDALYSDDLMSKFYSKANQATGVGAEATRAFRKILQAIRASGKRCIKILEIGAGTGLLTYQFVEELQKHEDMVVEYTVTDISYGLVADLARNVPHAYMHAKAYDVGKAPESQGFLLEDYDVVVSLHVLHAAPDLAACLASLRQLLVPGGILLTVELDGNGWASKPGSIWFDCIFGSFPEWFGFTDRREHCAISPLKWQRILEACNFVGVQTCSEHGASGREFFFIAQKPTGIRFASTPSINLPDVYRYKFGREMELKKWILAQSRPTPVYIIVQHGHDAQAATGLCAGLRKDIPSLQIRLCIFASPAQIHNPSLLISRHLNLFAFEDTIYFNHAGTPLVPRVAPAASPAEAQAPPTASDLVSVKVNCWAEGSAPRQGFVGTVLADHPCGLSKGEFVAAVQDIQEEDIIFVPPSVLIHTQRQSTGFPHDVLASVLVSIIDASLPPRKSTLVLAVDDDNLSCSLLGKFVTLPLIEIAELDWKASHIHASVDILFTDSRTYSKYPHLRRWIRRSGKLVLWDRLLENALREDPNFVAHILSNTSHRSVLTGPPLRTRAIPREKFASPPFRPDRAYILLGGIGGLGADLAVWMYQNGARHLILTSRRGIKSLDSSRDTLILAKFAYLLSQEGLTLRLEACDGTKTHAMAALLNSIPVPIAGCFHMTLVLSDSHFAAQTESSFRQVFDSKVKVLNAFAATIDITSLDFFVAFSSLSGLVGMPGQSNYASACTALEGALSRYPNAFSLVTPGIFDAGYLERTDKLQPESKIALASMYAEDLWACLADGLQFLDFGPSPLSIYIPALDWQALDRTLTLRASCRHLIPSQHASALPPRAADGGRVDGSDLKSRVVELLELSESDFDARQPLVNYGLDSLSASKLSSLLKPFAQLSQLQLLGGLTWTDIEELLDSASEPSSTSSSTITNATAATDVLLKFLNVSSSDFSPRLPLSSYGLDSLGASRAAAALQPHMPVTQVQLLGQKSWEDLLAPISRASPPPVMQPEAPADVDIFVEICSGPGIPLILLPGATGSTSRFLNLRGRVKGAVWGINITLECPLGSLHELVVFLSNQIRRRFPCGPYRIGSFCATSAHTIALVKLLEDSGQDVQQLIFLDHFPLMWVHADHEDGFCRGAVDDLLSIAKEKVILMLERDPSISPGSVAELRAAIGDAEDSAYPEGQVLHRLLRMIFAFMEELYPHDEEFSYVRFVDAWTSWVSSVKAPFALVIAEHGLRSVVPNTGDWANYGAGRMEYEVPIHYLDNVGHWGIFSDDRLATVLDGGEIEGE